MTVVVRDNDDDNTDTCCNAVGAGPRAGRPSCPLAGYREGKSSERPREQPRAISSLRARSLATVKITYTHTHTNQHTPSTNSLSLFLPILSHDVSGDERAAACARATLSSLSRSLSPVSRGQIGRSTLPGCSVPTAGVAELGRAALPRDDQSRRRICRRADAPPRPPRRRHTGQSWQAATAEPS